MGIAELNKLLDITEHRILHNRYQLMSNFDYPVSILKGLNDTYNLSQNISAGFRDMFKTKSTAIIADLQTGTLLFASNQFRKKIEELQKIFEKEEKRNPGKLLTGGPVLQGLIIKSQTDEGLDKLKH